MPVGHCPQSGTNGAPTPLASIGGHHEVNSPTYLFLDTEWADAAGLDLVSIALISADGAYSYYAERDPLPAVATDFVRQIVFPLLERGEAAMTDDRICRSLREFLGGISSPNILADYPNDLSLFQRALGGFDLTYAQKASLGPIPQFVTTQMLRDEAVTSLLEAWFRRNPIEGVRRHHAMVDANALRMAWLAATGRTVF